MLSLAFFVALELWTYFSAFDDPTQHSSWRQLAAPASLLLGLVAYGCVLRIFYLRRMHPFTVALLVAPLVLLIALWSPWYSAPKSSWLLEVRKKERLLKVFHDGEEFATYPIALSSQSTGDKVFMGDGQTPVGRFRIVDKGPSHFHKWMGLNYPTTEDAWRGRRDGLLMWAEFLYILMENRNGRIPYSSSAVGGAVGLHGGGSENDWTLGCVALENEDIDKFFDRVPLGTEVIVKP